MNTRELGQYLNNIQQDFAYELRHLDQQGILTSTDIKKIMIQAEASREALDETINRSDFSVPVQDELLQTLVEDYQYSVEKLIDKAVYRRGGSALLKNKLDREERRLLSEIEQLRQRTILSRDNELLMKGFLDGARILVTAMIPNENSQSKIKDVTLLYVNSSKHYLAKLAPQYNQIDIRILG